MDLPYIPVCSELSGSEATTSRPTRYSIFKEIKEKLNKVNMNRRRQNKFGNSCIGNTVHVIQQHTIAVAILKQLLDT